MAHLKKYVVQVSGCGSFVRVVASNSRGQQSESTHQENLCYKFAVNCIEKPKIQEKEAGNGPF